MLGYYGKSDMDQAKTDMVIDCIEDMVKFTAEITKSETEEQKVSYNTCQIPSGLNR